MESQLTLVNPAPPATLTFHPDSMSDSVLYSDTRALYAITTHLQHSSSCTELRRAGETEVIARISRNSILPDTVSFASEAHREVRISKWLRKCKLPDGISAHAIDTVVGLCILRTHREYRLALYTEFDADLPVAHWEATEASRSVPPQLVIANAIPESLHPQIICAFVVEEFRMRMAEKADVVAQAKAAAHVKTLAQILFGSSPADSIPTYTTDCAGTFG
ncbi:hypothetical protein MKEN_01174100 [Mycena kentingensis (nom. inval.)]|nr:hypothetical protein MKEN_01174100 [Mycena kentingensis (nom. inval.)]